MLAASVTLLVASDHEPRAFLRPSEAARRRTGGVVSVARPSSFLARKPHDSSPRGVAHPHGSPQMSHVIPRHVFQTLKSGRCNSNVFSAHQKLTEGNYVRVFEEERLPPAREIAAHPHGSPQMSHVIPRHVFQTLKSGRCNSNVFRAYRKLTEGNYVRLFGEERLPPADAGPARPRDRRTPAWFPKNVARNSPNHPSNFEIESLRFQRFQGISKTDQDKLRATFGGEYAPANAVRPACLPASRGRPEPGARPSDNPGSRLKPRVAYTHATTPVAHWSHD